MHFLRQPVSWFRALPAPSRIYYSLLTLAAAACTLYLAAGPKPWEKGIGPRLETGKSVGIREYIVSGEYWAAAINLALSLLLLGAGRWLLAPAPAACSAPLTPSKSPSKEGPSARIVSMALAAAVALSAWINAPLLTQSLWGDEEFTMRKHIVGEVARDPSTGELALEDLSWQTTLWLYKNPNNHIFFTILSRLSHSLVPKITAPDRPYFSEFALRLPAYLAGIAAVWACGYFLCSLGHRRAALLAPFLLAVHPWFIRYSAQARGYSLVLLFQLICLILLVRCLQSGRWKWWMLYAWAQFLLFYTNPATLYFILTLNAAALLLILTTGRAFLVRRWIVAGVTSAMAVIQMMAPCLLPFQAWLQRPRAQGAPGLSWIRDTLGYLATGIPWSPWEQNNPLAHSLFGMAHGHSAFMGFLALLAMVALLLGVWHLARRAPWRWLLLPLLLPAPLTVLHNTLAGNLLYHWYLIGSVPAVVMLWALGAEFSSRAARDPSTRSQAFLGVGLTLGILFFTITRQQRRIERTKPVEPNRESVLLTREIINPFDPRIDDVMTVGFHMFTIGYDPALRRVRTFPEFTGVLREADDAGKPLHVNLAQPGMARIHFPEIMATLENSQYFTWVETLHGLHDPCTRYVYRYRPDSYPAE